MEDVLYAFAGPFWHEFVDFMRWGVVIIAKIIDWVFISIIIESIVWGVV
jgi:hypothetical protein